MADETALRELTRSVLIQHPDLSATAARTRAADILRDEEYAAMEAAAVEDAKAWSASGRPLDEYFAGTWAENAGAEAARAERAATQPYPDADSGELVERMKLDFGSNPMNPGGFTEEQKASLAKTWADAQAADVQAARDAGREV